MHVGRARRGLGLQCLLQGFSSTSYLLQEPSDRLHQDPSAPGRPTENHRLLGLRPQSSLGLYSGQCQITIGWVHLSRTISLLRSIWYKSSAHK